MTASQYGLDGRSTKGHKDDYYYSYGSRIDPYYTGSWAEHSPKDSVADFMGTNMNQQFSNTDGSTTFWFTGDGSPLEDYTGCEPGSRDGMHGMHLFAESRGYTVTRSYNQYITGFYSWFTDGFTYDKYKAEIDAGYPVIIQLNGHSVLGIGYYGTNGMVIHDTWDYSDHTMTWGGYYANMQHYAVGVIHLAPAPDPLQAKFYGVPDAVVSPLTIHFYDASTGSPTSWNWNFGEGGNVTTQNATHTYTTPGTYTVSLTVSKGTSSSQSNAVISYEQGIYPDA
jgi:PKD repeat protein